MYYNVSMKKILFLLIIIACAGIGIVFAQAKTNGKVYMESVKIKNPSVAGIFYPSDKDKLVSLTKALKIFLLLPLHIESLLADLRSQVTIRGLLL